MRCDAGAMTVMNEPCAEIDCYYTKSKREDGHLMIQPSNVYNWRLVLFFFFLLSTIHQQGWAGLGSTDDRPNSIKPQLTRTNACVYLSVCVCIERERISWTETDEQRGGD